MAFVRINGDFYDGARAFMYFGYRRDRLVHSYCWYTRLARKAPWRKAQITCSPGWVDAVIYIGADKRCWITRTVDGTLGLLLAHRRSGTAATWTRRKRRDWLYIEGPEAELVHAIPDEFFAEALEALRASKAGLEVTGFTCRHCGGPHLGVDCDAGSSTVVKIVRRAPAAPSG